MPLSDLLIPVEAYAASAKLLHSIYVLFIFVASALYFFVAHMEVSMLLTLAAMFQCFAMILLALIPRGVHCISVRSVLLHIVAFSCRLSSTTWLNGYLPVDATGDRIYQISDVVALCIATCVALRTLAEMPWIQAVKELMSVIPTFLVAFALALLLHADLNKRPMYDAIWLVGLFVGSAAVFSQFWKVQASSKEKGATIPLAVAQAHTLAMHCVFALVMSHLASAVYMWHARDDIEYTPIVEDVNHSICAILAANLLPVLLVCDFAVNDDET